jgi:threonine/homoserine/homoserine lactone efflux protein
MTDPILFGIAVVAILATPGPTNTLLATAGAANGLRRSLPLVPAELAAYLIAIMTIGFLISPIISNVPMLGAALRLAVAVYLTVLALRLWRRGAGDIVQERLVRPRDVFVTTLLNPKAIILATGVIPLHHPDSAAYVAAFCLVLVLISLTWISIGVVVARGVLSTAGWAIVPRVGATALWMFAVILTVTAFNPSS